MTHHALRLAQVALFIATVISSRSAFATMTIDDVTGASNVEDLSESTPVVYGGFAGELNQGTCDSDVVSAATSTCNSCYDNGQAGDARLIACNTNRAYPELQLTFTAKSDKVDSGQLIITDEDGDTIFDIEGSAETISKGTSGSVTITWANLCSALQSGDATCITTSGAWYKTIRVGVDDDGNDQLDDSTDDYKTIKIWVSDGEGSTNTSSVATNDCDTTTGLCQFDVAPGDGKVKVSLLESDASFPDRLDANEPPFVNVVFWLDQSLATVTPGSSYFSLAIVEEEDSDSATFSLESELITGLSNETNYYFKHSVQDAAMNIGFYTADADFLDCFPPTSAGAPCHSARPGEVVGILSKDVNCFVATAAWGSAMAPQVETFRRFRNRFLLPTKLGKAFVDSYYKHGPIAARFIAESESLRFTARILLWPALAFAWLSLKLGLISAILITLLVIATPIAIFKRRKSRQVTVGL